MNELSLIDFAILRAEFTTNSNHEERERYAEEKIAITTKELLEEKEMALATVKD